MNCHDGGGTAEPHANEPMRQMVRVADEWAFPLTNPADNDRNHVVQRDCKNEQRRQDGLTGRVLPDVDSGYRPGCQQISQRIGAAVAHEQFGGRTVMNQKSARSASQDEEKAADEPLHVSAGFRLREDESRQKRGANSGAPAG